MRSFSFFRLARAVRLVRAQIISTFSYKKNMLYFYENHNETMDGGELVFYAEPALKLYHRKSAGPVNRCHMQTRAEPRTTNPQCFGDRRSPLRNPTAQVPRGN